MRAVSSAPRSGLLQFANLWTLLEHPSRRREWSLERKVAAIAEAGFDGVIGVADPALQKAAEAHGLRIWGWCWCEDAREIPQELKRQQDHGAEWINTFVGHHDTPPSEAVKLAVALYRSTEKLNLPVAIETHRNTATETPEKIAELARLFEQETGRLLPLCWDFSHLAVVKHLTPSDYAERLIAPHHELIKHAQQFHFRPFNGQHAQIPLLRGDRHTPEMKPFLAFVESVLRVWLSAPANRKRPMLVCPEIGPASAGYGFAGGTPAWTEACHMRLAFQKAWRRAAKP